MPIDVTKYYFEHECARENLVFEYKLAHIDLDSESNGAAYLNKITDEGWVLDFIHQGKKELTHPLCIFRRVKKEKIQDF